MWIIWGLLAGVVVGIFSGMVGVGGGVLLVPILFYAFNMDQKLAQGTSLAMLLPPTGLLAFLSYYRHGNADLRLGLVIAVGVFVGGWFGGEWAHQLSGPALRKIFAVFMAILAVKMFFEK